MLRSPLRSRIPTLEHSLIQDAVNEIHVFYAEKPSYGHTQNIPCPEHELELQTAAHRFLHKPLTWHVGAWNNEIEHREAFIDVAKEREADLILVVDADELWVPGSAEKSLKYVYDQYCARRWFCHFQNFWRSFDWEIRDHFQSVRIIDTRFPLDFDAHLENNQPDSVFHYGYAQSIEIMKYKWTCHGHQLELRPGWFKEKFKPWSPVTNTPLDLHPTVNDLWDRAYPVSRYVKKINKRLLFDHPYYDKERIS